MGLRGELLQVGFTQERRRVAELPQFHKARHDKRFGSPVSTQTPGISENWLGKIQIVLFFVGI